MKFFPDNSPNDPAWPLLFLPFQGNWTGAGIFLVIFLCSFALPAQSPTNLTTLTIDDGLGFRKVKAITQDSRGLMWFGTTQDIERFDGSRFIRFGNDRQADYSFLGEHVLNEGLLPINDTVIWAVVDKQLFAINTRSHSWYSVSKSARLPGEVCELQQGPDGKIWLVTDDGRLQYLLRFDLNTRKFRQVATAPHLHQPFTDVAPDTAGNVWWSTISEGLRLFSPEGQQLHAIKPDSFIWYGTKMYFTPVFVDSRGRIFIFPKSKYQIREYHPEQRQYSIIADQLATPVYHALEDNQGNLWFAMRTGVLQWNTGRNPHWTDYSAEMKEVLEFSDIYDMFEDRTHMLWISTNNGLFKFPAGKKLFRIFHTKEGARWGNAMRGIFQDKRGAVYAFCESGQQGIYRLDTESGKSIAVLPFGDSTHTGSILELSQHYIPDVRENWVWTLTDKLLQINLDNGRGTVIADFQDAVDRFTHNPLIQLQDGRMLLGSSLEKLWLYDPQTGKRKSVPVKTDSAATDIKTDCFLEAPDHSVWIGTTNGLYRIDLNGKILAHISTATQPALSKDHVLCLYMDQKNCLWVGTYGGGLNYLEGISTTENSNFRITSFSTREGLCDNNVTGILEDENGNIWISTYRGLSCYRPEAGAFQNFFEEDGLSNNEFNYSSFLMDAEGRMWFGGMNGVNMFNPVAIVQAERNPALCLTAFTRYNQDSDSLETQIIGNQELPGFIISPYDSWFQLGWSLPNYRKPGKHHYYVWLDGLEENWSYLGNTPFVRYNKLPAGKYTLRVKGSDSQGNWSEQELAIPITVEPFFYQTWWFYLLVAVLGSSIIFLIARYRLRRQLEMERMRTRIASDLHDEVGSMLSGLAMQAELLEMESPGKDHTRLKFIGDISRTAVSKMRDLVWSLDSRRDRVQNLLDRMQEQAAEFLHAAGIEYRFELGELPLGKKLPVDKRQHLFLIFKEALHNVVRHSDAREVLIRFGNFDGIFELSVYDTGPAKAKPVKKSGLGLGNMQARAKKMGAQFELIRQNGFLVRLRMKAI